MPSTPPLKTEVRAEVVPIEADEGGEEEILQIIIGQTHQNLPPHQLHQDGLLKDTQMVHPAMHVLTITLMVGLLFIVQTP